MEHMPGTNRDKKQTSASPMIKERAGQVWCAARDSNPGPADQEPTRRTRDGWAAVPFCVVPGLFIGVGGRAVPVAGGS